jgi:hypothetical protein
VKLVLPGLVGGLGGGKRWHKLCIHM